MSPAEALSDGQARSVISAVRERYGFELGSLFRLGGELDWNFRASTVDGDQKFLRLTPSPLDATVINWQNAVLMQLEQQPLSVESPRLLRQIDGSVDSTLTFDNGQTFLLRMTSWVPGANVADFGATDRAYRLQLGGLAAEVIESLSALNFEGDPQNAHHWMVVRSGASIRATIAAAADPARRALLDSAIKRFDQVQHLIPDLPMSVVHQDLHDFNLLATRNQQGETRISGVVDFNDALYTARIAELAVAASYAALRQQDPFGAFCEVVEGYLTHAELTDLELDVLYPLAVARLAVNASTWTLRSQGENAEYAESRMAATWPALEAMTRISSIDAASRFHNLNTRRSNSN